MTVARTPGRAERELTSNPRCEGWCTGTLSTLNREENHVPSIVTVGTFDRYNIAGLTKILQEFDREVAPQVARLRAVRSTATAISSSTWRTGTWLR